MPLTPGARVRCVSGAYDPEGPKEGREYEVEFANEHNGDVKLVGVPKMWMASRFAPVEPVAPDWRSRWQEKTRGGWDVQGVFTRRDGRLLAVLDDSVQTMQFVMLYSDGLRYKEVSDDYDLLPLAPPAPPEPARVPMDADDIRKLPADTWVRMRDNETGAFGRIVAISGDRVYMGTERAGVAIKELVRDFVHSIDHGSTWADFTKPCGTEAG